MSQRLRDAIVDLRMDESLLLARQMLAGGTDPLDIIADAGQAMEAIGRRYAEGEAFLPELIMGGEIMKVVSKEVLPEGSAPDTAGSKATVVIGTVRGDIHDIGKDIVALMLEIDGYAVRDLGTDVPAEDFVAAVKEHGAGIVALSGLLTLAFDAMKSTVDAIAAAGLRSKVRIMIGGAAVDENVCVFTGADGWGDDAGRAVKLATAWTDGDA